MMQIGTVTNQYNKILNINLDRSKHVATTYQRAIQTTQQSLLEAHHKKQQETMRAIMYMMLMQFYYKNQMMYMVDTLRLTRTVDTWA